ncbi:MAG: endonuclease/exonuclease/phosphatase family protein [Flavobacteriales bacterium]|nr:endonuclease/exonuclease/phosphatase family protein [Flavobacteriales bacterium]MDG1934719.1 endonuclease/exonuclease/phosphatase family protein [Flavobacteriales bacterium]MDG2085946.1 endonuclease/exonuclease/phosphatase family protein [Flavobacteriales bacterium]|tara:strand:- start:874 stop:1923 length:1050 start_codon:yes stop_codon:yes gene_type:complete
MKKLSIINKFLFLLNSLSLLLLVFSYSSPFSNPNNFWPISFIGLIFPVLYLINILFLIYWLIGLKKQVLPNIIILLFGINNVSSFIGLNSKAEQEDNSNLKILSYNVRLFNKYNWLDEVNVYNKITNFIDKESPDIVCIQEFFVKDTTPSLNYKYHHIGIQDKKGKSHMAIYSKYNQINKETVTIKGKKMNNICIFSDIVVKEDTLRVYNLHLASNWFNSSDYSFIHRPKKSEIKKGLLGISERMRVSFKKRANEASIIRKHIDSSPYPVILCGDFNDTPMSYSYNKIKGELSDAFCLSGKGTGNSYVKIPTLRIDYIMHDKHINSINFQTHNLILSDHYAISCEITNP